MEIQFVTGKTFSKKHGAGGKDATPFSTSSAELFDEKTLLSSPP